jgi:hypothetical protein
VTGQGDDTGSLLLALLLVILGSMLAAVMLPMFLTQLSSTQANNRLVHQLDAAEAGVDVALGQIRAANDGHGNGVIASLPCGPFTGTVSTAATERYYVTITYYAANPQGQSASWLSSTSNIIRCASGGSGAASTPNYALITSQGADSATGSFTPTPSIPVRKLTATYTFTTNNQNIAGGLIHQYVTSGRTDVCLDAGSALPAAGTPVTMQVCSSGSAQQTWAYTSNLYLQLVSSKTVANPYGMCIDGGSPETGGATVVLQPCGSSVKAQQQWSFNYDQGFQGTTDGVNANGPCLWVSSSWTPGASVVLANASTACYLLGGQQWTLDSGVGPGAASAATGQVVNYAQFGRCFDFYGSLTNEPLDAGTCKQEPKSSNVRNNDQNQYYTLPSPAGATTGSYTGQMYTPGDGLHSPTGSNWCVVSPLSTAAGQYVTIVQCTPGSLATNTTWTQTLNSGTYATSWTIKDSNGNCLQPASTPAPAGYDIAPYGFSLLIVQPCNGSTLQKWNAPPNVNSPTPLSNIFESH